MSEQRRLVVAIANSIRMKRSVDPERSFLVVEGNDDKAFYARRAKSCSIIVASGRPNVVGIVMELDRTGFVGALGVVDADFTVLDGESIPSSNLVVTDHHDIESMMVDSPALEHLLHEVANEARDATAIKDYLLCVGKNIGYLRWASARNKWALKFEGLDFTCFVRESDLNFNTNSLFVAVRNHQGGRSTPLPTEDEMQMAVGGLMSSLHNIWHVCNGNDLIELLAIGLRKVWGQNNEASVCRARLELQLRLAYEERYFQKTLMYQAIVQWEIRNPPFKIL